MAHRQRRPLPSEADSQHLCGNINIIPQYWGTRRRRSCWTYTSCTSSSIQLSLFIWHREIPVGTERSHVFSHFVVPLKWSNNRLSGSGWEGDSAGPGLKSQEVYCLTRTLKLVSGRFTFLWISRYSCMCELCAGGSPAVCPACVSTDWWGLTPAWPAVSPISSWYQICFRSILGTFMCWILLWRKTHTQNQQATSIK